MKLINKYFLYYIKNFKLLRKDVFKYFLEFYKKKIKNLKKFRNPSQ